ncbi:NUDIX domain-containing protein [Acidaminobacter sp.]|uniref:NUDIX domain-containing protein n=1 Tax=Acidaminobacter sp. TaxID=1872102 RepID=UPI0013814295|nr:NUDIX domain-containing protein [Acidaminobacter sp.]MDK9710112.1 NUDIX domain-containing protein [Acidaminobacter sp.]MZQ98417.1 NUDIX domain-containing protein [Acidaminobacter sp.]
MEKRNSRGQTQAEFLADYHAKPHAYPKPSLTADLAVFRRAGEAAVQTPKWQILAVKRGNHPCIDQWALPGGFFDVKTDVTLEACAVRELWEETGLVAGTVFPLGVYSQMGRDPRDRIVSQLFASVMPEDFKEMLLADDDAADAQWMDLEVLWFETPGKAMVAEIETALEADTKRYCKIVLRHGEEVAEQSLEVTERWVDLGVRKGRKVGVVTIGKGTLAFDHAEMILEAYRWLTGE